MAPYVTSVPGSKSAPCAEHRQHDSQAEEPHVGDAGQGAEAGGAREEVERRRERVDEERAEGGADQAWMHGQMH